MSNCPSPWSTGPHRVGHNLLSPSFGEVAGGSGADLMKQLDYLEGARSSIRATMAMNKVLSSKEGWNAMPEVSIR